MNTSREAAARRWAHLRELGIVSRDTAPYHVVCEVTQTGAVFKVGGIVGNEPSFRTYREAYARAIELRRAFDGEKGHAN